MQEVDETLDLFNLGMITVEMRALVERLFWGVCGKILRMVREMESTP